MTSLEEFKEDFKDLPPMLYELLIKHYNLNKDGCIHRGYQEYYNLMKNKECALLDFYSIEDLEYLRVESEINSKIEFNKEYFLSNTFIFLNISDDETKAYFKNERLCFYIIQNPGSGYDYDCCASIVLRYKAY